MNTPLNTAEQQSREADFIDKLEGLDRGDLARLRRNAGRTLSESRNVLGLFYRILPSSVPEWDHERYFLCATLYPLADSLDQGNFGTTMRLATNSDNAAGIERRFRVLLDADQHQLPFRLRQLVRLAHANRVGINWLTLLEDLRWWSHQQRRVQKRWAMSYYGQSEGSGNGATE